MADAPSSPLRILHLEDSPTDHLLVRHSLQRSGTPFDMERVETLDSLLQAVGRRRFDVVVADYRLPGFTAVDAWLALCAGTVEVPPFVLLSGAIGEPAAVDAIRQGISDYLLKDDIAKLPHVIARSIEVRQARLARERADRELAASERRLAELTEHLQTSIEQERSAIAREIHDDIGGALTAVKFDLGWIARHAADEDMRTHAQAAADMLRHAIGASQRIMMNLRPPILDQGLVAAIQWLAGNFEQRTGTALHFRAPHGPLALHPDVELVAYRTAQEALTNITKYALCSQVVIDLSDAEGVLTLEIADNGCGLPPEARDKPKAFGLRGLQERAKTVDGWLDISAPAGGGTSIILSVPLTAAQRAAACETP
ncbi:MAG: histidine kinase [Pseudomonadota bacterium]